MKVATLDPARAARVEERCLCFAAQRTARALGRRYDAALRQVDLSNWQFTLLMMLVREEVPTIGTLSQALVMDRTTVTANLKPLLRRGLLNIHADLEDRRVRRVVISEKGRGLLADALPLWEKVQADCDRLLGDNRRNELRTALETLSA
jgi:DNA-binding MarR family transcriptional regulator